MPKHVFELLVIAALVLAIICTVSPNATIIANEMSGEIYGIDIAGFTTTTATAAANDSDEVSAQRYAKQH